MIKLHSLIHRILRLVREILFHHDRLLVRVIPKIYIHKNKDISANFLLTSGNELEFHWPGYILEFFLVCRILSFRRLKMQLYVPNGMDWLKWVGTFIQLGIFVKETETWSPWTIPLTSVILALLFFRRFLSSLIPCQILTLYYDPNLAPWCYDSPHNMEML